MSFSVILPTLNEAGHIVQLVKTIGKILSKYRHEIIIVDDNSTDSTPELCIDLKKKNKKVYFFSRKGLKRNLAKSINLGIKKSKYENVIWLDADFQHPPQYIKLFTKFQKDFDVVIFSRFLPKSKRYFINKKFKKEINENQSIFFNKVCKFFLFDDITDYTSGFICIKRKIFKNHKLVGYYGEYFINLITHCKLQNKTIKELPYNERPRYSGASKTLPEISFKYLILMYKYSICLFLNILKKIFTN